MTVEIPKASGLLSDWLRVTSHLCDSLISQWTRRQAELVCVAADPKEPNNEMVAQWLKPKVSKQAVAKGLKGANWNAIREAIHQFERTSWEAASEPFSSKR